MKRVIPLTFVLCVLSVNVQAQDSDVRRLMAAFIGALQNLDWPAFRQCWADNPVLYGNADTTRREGASFESEWRMGFQQMREAAAARGVTSAPYVKVDPEDMRIDFPSPTVAVVTFHLTSLNRLRRRMFVAAKTGSGWKITHLDVSDISAR